MEKILLKVYTLDWNNPESDSLHLAYSYDGKDWFELNGNNGVLFVSTGSKRMVLPKVVKDTAGFSVLAKDPENEDNYYSVFTSDFIDYDDIECVDKSRATDYDAASDVVEIGSDLLKKLQEKFGKPEPVNVLKVEDVKIKAKKGASVPLPEEVSVTFSNGYVSKEKVVWEGYENESYITAENKVIKGHVGFRHYKNPLIYHRADPFITKSDNGDYYFVASHTDMEHNLVGEYQYRYILLRTARTIAGLADGSGEYTERTVYTRDPLPGNCSPHIWAPEIHNINGKWYIYFTTVTDENNCWSIRPHVLECDGDPMKDEWKFLGPIKKTVDDGLAFTDFSLDHTILKHNGEVYLFWAEKHPELSDIYAARMENPWTIDSSRVTKVVAPEYNWELHGFPVCEGPSFLKRNGKIFMTYSASGTDSLYCMGMITADENSDILDAKSWTKSKFPVFQSSDITGQYGPGHNSFTVDEDGNDVLVYHARQEKHYLNDPGYQPLYDAGRNASVMRFFLNPDGTPNFGIPTESGEDTTYLYEVTLTVETV